VTAAPAVARHDRPRQAAEPSPPEPASPRQSLLREVASHFALDVPLAVLLVAYCALLLPLVPRWTDNARMLAAFTNDEPFITQQLDGMTVPPYGNPSNFLEPKNDGEIPVYWFNYRYFNLIYYGGTYLDAGFAAYMPLKALGAPAFPTAPIILRAISFLSGLLSLVLLYNFAKRHAGRFAALFATAALMFESNFFWMATTIHPDMLQLALTLLCLVLAARHARLGDLPSAGAMGVVLGVIQGTKSGAVFLLPMIGLALLIGAWARPREGRTRPVHWLLRATGHLTVVGVMALIAFVASTPYLVFDPYYIATTKGAFVLLNGDSPLIPISFATWYVDIVFALGWPFVLTVVAGVAWFLLQGAGQQRLNGALVLALVLGVANLLWFTGLGRFWVVLYYLLAALGLLSIFAGALIARVARAMAARRRPGLWLGRALLAVALLLVACGMGRPAALAQVVASGVSAERTPQIGLSHWAEQNLPGNSTILFDDEAYFDPTRFPDQATNANLIRYSDLMRRQPDYFVLTDYPPAANWIMIKRQTQNLGPWDDDPYSVRLYQDLIDRSKTPYTPGPSPVPNIQLVTVVGLPWFDKLTQPAWFWLFDTVYVHIDPGYAGLQTSLSSGHRLLMFHVDRQFYEQPTPTGFLNPPFKPISSPTEKGYAAANAFDATSQVWLAKGQGPAVDGAYIGVDYGPAKGSAASLTITWVAAHWLPPSLRIENSDDGLHWTTVLTRSEMAPADQAGSPGLKRWSERIPLPPAGAHRFWRIVALDIAPNNYFGIDEMALQR
jgi:hypothetical protein